MRVPPTPLQALLDGPVRAGELLWIGIRPARHAAILAVESAELVTARRIEGDRYDTKTDGARQVTLISAEGLSAIASYLGRTAVPPELPRRNLLIRGINLLALKGRNFRVGAALLAYSGECAPCSQMEQILGPGGYNAVRGSGGITARILQGGTIRIGDAVTRAD